MSSIGSVGSSALITFNKTPYIEIEYPIPLIPIGMKDIKEINMVNDTIVSGLNIFDSVVQVRMNSDETTCINNEEMSELISILKGGVIYIGS